MAPVEHRDPLTDVSGPDTHWTTTNAGEQMPGVLTPLNWRLFDAPADRGMRGALVDIGVWPETEARFPESVDERSCGLFYGRLAVNVDELRKWYDLIPLASGRDLEAFFLGKVREGVDHTLGVRRYPVVAFKYPLSLALAGRRLRAMADEVDAWRRKNTNAAATMPLDDAKQLIREAVHYNELALRRHMVATLFANLIYGRVASFVAEAGRPGLESTLLGGYGTHELDIAADFWEISRGRLTVDVFIDRHGYHSQGGGELAALSWREEPDEILALVETYRGLPDADDPRAVGARRAQEREAAKRELVGGLGKRQRIVAEALLSQAGRFMKLRSVGKVAMIQSYDVGRAASRRLGRLYVEQGLVDHPDDVFLLTGKEVLGTLPADLHGVIEERRAYRESHKNVSLPQVWVGNPVIEAVAPVDETDLMLQGIGVSPGVVTGRARVVKRPTDADILAGDVLVCETTDPSWMSIMAVAAGFVIDMGGPVSHGAIVARELGTPCVMGVGDGTRRIRTGQLVRVDGSTGVVEIVDPVPVAAAVAAAG